MAQKFPSLPKTTLETVIVIVAALACITLLAALGRLDGETAAQMVVSMLYGALAAWFRGTSNEGDDAPPNR